ncbi:MAG: DegT/DnrJ/EryC1/StrS family aminotransferase [Candidatus Baltobacteraceae bacterium]
MRDTFLPYCRPDTTQAEIDAVSECVRNGWLTSGPKVRDFEAAFARISGVKHAVAVNSCTAALHIGLLAAGVGPGDEVVTPALTFVAGAQCALEVGAQPVFCDVDPATLSVTVETIDAVVTGKTRAIIVMPYGGRPLDIRAIVEYANERGIAVIEDAAHACGTLDRGEWAGSRSRLAAYSFYATKNLTTAEGGMLLTNDDAVMERSRILSLHGMDRDAWKRYTQRGSWRYEVREPGFKYNMPDIAAAMGLVQLERLDRMQARRRAIAAQFREAFSQMRGVVSQADATNAGDVHSYCMYVVQVDERAALRRDQLIEALKERNIGTSVHYIPTHHFAGYRRFANAHLEVTDRLGARILSLPLYSTMTDADARDVIDAMHRCLKQPSISLAG